MIYPPTMLSPETPSNGTQRPLDGQAPPFRVLEPSRPAAHQFDDERQHPPSRPAKHHTPARPLPLVLPRGDDAIERRDVEPADVSSKLRGMLGLLPEQPAWGEAAASLHRALPPVVHGLDAGAWIAWCMVGLVLFSGDFPSFAIVRRETKRALLALVMLRTHGNVSSAGRMTGTSRKVLRDGLKQGNCSRGMLSCGPPRATRVA
jgi:hypothetical protein